MMSEILDKMSETLWQGAALILCTYYMYILLIIRTA